MIATDPSGEESAAWFSAIVASAMDAIIMVEADGRIVLFNSAAERIFGCKSEDALGTSLDRFIPERHRARHGKAMSGFGAGTIAPRKMGAARDVVALRADGTEFAAEASIAKSELRGRRFFTAVIRDVTDRIEAERRLQQLNDTLEERVQRRTEALLASVADMEAFAYTVAHDLRAPVRAVDGYAQMVLEDEPALSAESVSRLEAMRDNADWMGRMIEGLLTFSRISRAQPVQETVDLRELALEALHAMRGRGRRDTVNVGIAEGSFVRGDRALLRQVLEQLLSNAFKFSSKAAVARVDLRADARDGRMVVTIADNGVGFDMRFADKLFGVFQRLHHRDQYDGVGVGLAIAKRILDQHGERIWAEASPGAGAAFHFTLRPAAEPRKGAHG